MNLKAIIPQGQTEITVNGLHQWDYGRKLEIHSADFPAMVEVHFACVGMKEAAVRVCETVNGVATASIPDHCLEQTTPIVAWVFEIDGTTGVTTKTIILPVKERPRPQKGGEIPTEVSDKYTELITEVNRAVSKVSTGEIKARYAQHADTAGSATTATNATNATNAANAKHANTATYADGAASVIANVTEIYLRMNEYTPLTLDDNSLYYFDTGAFLLIGDTSSGQGASSTPTIANIIGDSGYFRLTYLPDMGLRVILSETPYGEAKSTDITGLAVVYTKIAKVQTNEED